MKRAVRSALAAMVVAVVGASSAAFAAGALRSDPAPHPLPPPAVGDVGWLDVSSDPPAQIFIDEVDTHKMTPQPRLELRPGSHKLKLVTPDGGRTYRIGFVIRAGETTQLSIHLKS